MHLSGTEREAFLAEEAKRAKRNHKIFLLSKNNGMMTPQDKNFITRIQLQQLLTATGGVSQEPGGGDPLAEDFYYQVYAQIRGPPRSGPGQPLNQFAQTYLFQTGGGNRYGYGRSRHHPRGGNGGHGGNADNHVARMEQQVARAVEAAKARPKNKQLTMEGSLGKIAFSNSKTPRPLLNIKRPDTPSVAANVPANRPADRKTALRNVEALYTVLMQLEDHERRLPPPPNEESPPEVIEGHMRWRRDMQALNQRLWEASKVMEPIQQRSVIHRDSCSDGEIPPTDDPLNHSPTTSHPFIQFLGPSKGKKAIPRIFRHLDDQQRLTLLTLLAIHLDSLDAVRDTFPSLVSGTPLPAAVRDEVELFCAAVMPPLFSYVNEAPLGIIIGLVGLILDRVSVPAVVRTKVGISMLTMLISRAELVKQVTTGGGGGPGPGPAQQPPSPDDWQHWTDLYSRLFDTVEPSLPALFPATANPAASAADVHIWQFLAAMGVAAGPDQQQRLVLGVKDRVMETVAVARTLPADGGMRDRRLAEVNLFMRAIGLDVELLG
jgi:DNA topoisomerase 2-associated protein PAT1